MDSFLSCIGSGRVGSNFFHLWWFGLGWVSQSADGLGWTGSHKMEPWTTAFDLRALLSRCRDQVDRDDVVCYRICPTGPSDGRKT